LRVLKRVCECVRVCGLRILDLCLYHDRCWFEYPQNVHISFIIEIIEINNGIIIL
jgi:hypothetical protein